MSPIKKYSFNDHPEHRERLDEFRDKWTANALSTEQISEQQWPQIVVDINELYSLAELPAPKNIVHCTDPISGAISWALASCIWWLRKNPESHIELFDKKLTELDLRSGLEIAIKIIIGDLPANTFSASYFTYIVLRNATSTDVSSNASHSVDDVIRNFVEGNETYYPAKVATSIPIDYSINTAIDYSINTAINTSVVNININANVTKHYVDNATHYSANNIAGDTMDNATFSSAYGSTRIILDGTIQDAISSTTSSTTSSAARDVASGDVLTALAGFMAISLKFWNNGIQWGSHWSGISAFYDFLETVAKIPVSKYIRAWNSLAIVSGPRYMAEDFVIVCDRPTVLETESRRGRATLHCTTGPAMAWQTGCAVYAVHGVVVPAEAIESGVTLQMIEIEKNSEVTRVLVELYENGDEGKYLRDSGAEILDERQSDRGPWRLLRKRLKNGQTYLGVDVPNSTNEPDGSIRRYTIRVHPEARPMLNDGSLGEPQTLNVQNAVASTFGLKGSKYSPSFES